MTTTPESNPLRQDENAPSLALLLVAVVTASAIGTWLFAPASAALFSPFPFTALIAPVLAAWLTHGSRPITATSATALASLPLSLLAYASPSSLMPAIVVATTTWLITSWGPRSSSSALNGPGIRIRMRGWIPICAIIVLVTLPFLVVHAVGDPDKPVGMASMIYLLPIIGAIMKGWICAIVVDAIATPPSRPMTEEIQKSKMQGLKKRKTSSATWIAGGVLAILCVPFLIPHHRKPPNDWTSKYEIKIQMDTPSGQVSASGVMGSKGKPGSAYVGGEAIPIDLNDGRTVYMLVTKGTGSWEFYAPWVGLDRFRDLMDGKTVPMNPASYPEIVTFGVPDEPRSIIKVDPNDPSAVLGPGHSFRNISVTLTDKPVTERILHRLPWLKQWKTNAEGSTGINKRYLTHISFVSFKRYL